MVQSDKGNRPKSRFGWELGESRMVRGFEANRRDLEENRLTVRVGCVEQQKQILERRPI